jgi:REP element-mobilizing transposase RayT
MARPQNGAATIGSGQPLMTYFITFSCYGTHIHGDPEGSVDRNHNHYGAPLVGPNPHLLAAERRLMTQQPYEMDEPRRNAILAAIIDRCHQGDWHILAAHVRSNHVHVVVDGKDKPEFVMSQLKSAASRRLNDLGFDDRTRKRWARHGSTRTLWDRETIEKAIAYVVDGQGEPMSLFVTAPGGRGSKARQS